MTPQPQPSTVEALRDAAQSLRTIADQAGKNAYLDDMLNVRGYANSRASAAEIALAASQQAPNAGGRGTLVVIDDADAVALMPVVDRASLVEALRHEMFVDGDCRGHEGEVEGVADELIANGVIRFEGDRPFYLHRVALTPPASQPAKGGAAPAATEASNDGRAE